MPIPAVSVTRKRITLDNEKPKKEGIFGILANQHGAYGCKGKFEESQEQYQCKIGIPVRMVGYWGVLILLSSSALSFL